MIYLAIAAGLALLLAGGNFTVIGAVALAHRMGVSSMVIGATVIASGTTLPELVVSLEAALAGSPGIALGNLVGSNICNLLLILGAAAVIHPILRARGTMRRAGTAMVGAAVLLVVVAWDGDLARWEGVAMLALLAAYTIYDFRAERRGSDLAILRAREAEEIESHVPRAVPLIVVTLAGGIAGIIVGANLLVYGAIGLARQAGISESIIGLTMVAVGTSLPELVTGLTATLRRQGEVALGNVVGANIYNILGILGLVAVSAPAPVPDELRTFDIWVVLAITVLFVAWMWRVRRLGRPMGVAFLTAYGAYVAFLFAEGSGV